MNLDSLTPEFSITRRVSFALVAIALGTPICLAQNTMAAIDIQGDKPLHGVSSTLYGLMTEEINYSYDGGLYAEMVRNRTFQDHDWSGVAHWNIEQIAIVSMNVDPKDEPSEALSHSLLMDIKQADGA